jgi:hypothetical protein
MRRSIHRGPAQERTRAGIPLADSIVAEYGAFENGVPPPPVD